VSNLTQTTGYLVGNVFRLWADYWLAERPSVPPLFRVREGANREVFFGTPEPAESVLSFLSAQDRDRDFAFTPSAGWVLDEKHYLGDWCVFAVQLKR